MRFQWNAPARTTSALLLMVVLVCSLSRNVSSFQVPVVTTSATTTTTMLQMGLFDKWTAGGTGNSKAELDEQWELQQEILRNRRAPKEQRDKYFRDVEERRRKASEKQQDMWSWQSKTYNKGEDPIDEWKKRRASGQISDLNDQYGDEKKRGGLSLPMASFGVGGEFGVGGKFDNGGRFDLRLPYADQGYVDEDADVMKKFGNIFGGGNKKKDSATTTAAAAAAKKKESKKEQPKKKNWPW